MNLQLSPGLVRALSALWVFGALSASAAVLEIPGSGLTVSGVSIVSGWKCTAGALTVRFDGGPPVPLLYGASRQDTAAACGDDGRNGFITQFNYGILGPGNHVVRAYDNGVQFAQAAFRVAGLDEEFVRGLSGSFQVTPFPAEGEGLTLEWNEGLQSFVAVDSCGPLEPCAPNACQACIPKGENCTIGGTPCCSAGGCDALGGQLLCF